jgi:hypothetical protein
MDLRDLMVARSAAQPRPSWSSIFIKAYAKVTAQTPELRRVFVRWPWGRLYEHPYNIADVAIETVVCEEKVIVGGMVVRPERMDLPGLDRYVDRIKSDPMREKWLRRGMVLAKFPEPMRRVLWWLAVGWSGYRKARMFGTFGVTSVAFAGADVIMVATAVPNILHYGRVDAKGRVRVAIGFDHRIMDGACPARALVKLEEVLRTEIYGEVRKLTTLAIAA